MRRAEVQEEDDKDVTDFIDRVSLQNDPKLKIYRKNTRLLDAVETGDIERIARLLKLDANPNATCQLNSVSACHKAAMTSNDSLSMLLASGAQSFRIDAHGRTVLHLAAWAGYWKQIAILLDFSTELQNRITNKMSPKVETEIRNFCVEKKALINMPCKLGRPLQVSEWWSDSLEHNCVEFGKDIPEIRLGWTALHLASARAHLACVRLLLAAGADTCAQDLNGVTPLEVVGAALYLGFNIDAREFYDTITILLAAGGRLNNTANNNLNTINTPLHTAVELKSEAAIKKLLEAGASVTCLNNNGLTALHMCVNKQLKDHSQLLTNFEYGNQDYVMAIIDIGDLDGLTILHTAVKNKWIDGVRIALGAGASILKQAKDGESPFHYAAALGDVQIFQALLRFAKNAIDSLDGKGRTALFIAIEHKHFDIVKLLVENGASSTISHHDDKLNVLHIAAKHGHKEILDYLLTCGYYKIENMINEISLNDHRTPMFHAVVNNDLDCAQVLLKNGASINVSLPFKDSICQETVTTMLHIAAANNNFVLAEVLLRYDSDMINKRNAALLLPVHEACIHGHKEIITLFIHYGTDLSSKHPKTMSPIEMIMNTLPKPTEYMQEIFDSYITAPCYDIGNNVCKVIVDYQVLLPKSADGLEITVLKAFVDTGNRYDQRKLLHHPLIESFLYLKWKSLLPFFYVIIALYGLFVMSFNMYVMSLFYFIDRNKSDTDVPVLYDTSAWKIMTYVFAGYTTLQTICVKIISEKSYFSILDTWVNIIAAVLAMLLPSLVSNLHHQSEITRGVATVAVLLTWLELMFLLCRFPKWGFYVLMFGNVTLKVFKVLLTFMLLIIGFSICFMIQFRGKPPFETLWAAVSKTLVMMTSEYDYSSTIANKYSDDVNTDVHISVLRFVFVVFVVLASIVLMNLLIAVAVNDVNNLENIGNLTRLVKQVSFLSSVESLKKYIKTKFGKSLYSGRIFTRDSVIILNPQEPSCRYCKILPQHIKEAIFEKVNLERKQIDDRLSSLELTNMLHRIQEAAQRQEEKLEQISKCLKTICERQH